MIQQINCRWIVIIAVIVLLQIADMTIAFFVIILFAVTVLMLIKIMLNSKENGFLFKEASFA